MQPTSLFGLSLVDKNNLFFKRTVGTFTRLGGCEEGPEISQDTLAFLILTHCVPYILA